MPDSEFSGLKALVTGGASGIGLAPPRRWPITTATLADFGAAVGCLDINRGGLEPPPAGRVTGGPARSLRA